MPLEGILNEIDLAATQLPVGVRWVKVEGDPVALITIPPPEGEEDTLIWIDEIELRQGEIYLAGRTMPREEYTSDLETSDEVPEEAHSVADDQKGKKSSTQR